MRDTATNVGRHSIADDCLTGTSKPGLLAILRRGRGRTFGLLLALALLATACGSLASPSAPKTQSEPTTTPSLADLRSAGWAGPVQNLTFEHISIEHGLSHSTVNCILQDSYGFMWFGTDDGLNKYDGHTFNAYRHNPDDPRSLSHNQVWSLFEDSSGTLWVGTWGGGLNQFHRDTGSFTRYDAEDFQNVTDEPEEFRNAIEAIGEHPAGVLWIATYGGGLVKFDLDTESFTSYAPDPVDPRFWGHEWISAMLIDQSGTVWIGTHSEGLDRFDPATGGTTSYRHRAHDPVGLGHDWITDIIEDRSGQIWIATYGRGLDRFDPATERFTHYRHDSADPRGLSDDYLWSVVEDAAGVLWIGTYSGGLDAFDPQSGTFTHFGHDPTDPHSLSSDRVRSLHRSRSGLLWVGTRGGGVNKSDPASSRFAHHRGDTDDPWRPGDYRVLALHEDQHGVLWIGTDGGGIDALDRETGEWHHYRHDPADPGSLGTGSVHAIHEDASGTLWVGTDDGFYRFDRQAGRFDRLPHHPPDPGDVKQETVYSIDEDGQGILWLGTQGRGLSEFDPATGTFIYHQHGWDPDTGLPERHTLSSNFVRDVFEDASGRLWVGTTDGLSVFDRDAGQWHSLDHNPDEPGSLSHDWVMSLYGDQSGMLWVGTQGGGLNRLVLSQVKGSDPATCTFTHYREQDGLANDTVWDILEQDGHLWIATANGLSRFDPRTETFRSYDAGDALPINEFSAACASSSGELLFGGINGFISFYPAQMEPNPYTPPVVLTSLQQNGKEVNADRAPEDLTEVTFRWPDNTFEFGFAALNYTQPGKNQHAYMLEGFDEDWNHIGARRFGRYTNLPGGKYTLRLKGSNNDGVWNEEGASIQVAIVPPFWSTWWFRAIAALVLLAGVAAGYGLRVRSLQARSRDLEKQVMNRTKELAALNAIAATVSRSLDLDEVLNGALDKTLHVMEIEAGGIYLLDEEAGVLTVAAERGFSPEFVAGIDRLKVGEGFSGRVAQSGQPLLVRNISTDPRLTRMVVRHAGLRSAAIVPLSSKGKVLGTMFAITRGYREFTDQDIQLLTSIGDQIGVAVENARLYEQAQQVAVVEERQRLARELHDSVTQALYGVTLYSEAAAGHLALGHTDRTAEHLQELQDTAQEALAEMRLLVFELRPPILEELGLAAALQARLQAVEGRAGLRTEFKTNVDQRLPPDVEEGLYRIALEALNNALKHAQARNIKVHLRQEEPGRTPPARVTLEIADDGVGFDPATARERGGMGLSAMEERAAALGARLEVESRIGSGTTVTLTWEEDEGRATDDERQRLTEEDRRTDDALQV